MAFKKAPTPEVAPDTPDRLFLDLPRRKHASLFDHQGQVLRTYADTALEKPDVALQLPTGSGKTLVGLLMADWRRRKFRERVVYLCPTRQLVAQVGAEASTKYGLDVAPFTGPASEYSPASKAAYQDATRVAVTTYSALFNTNPFFRHPNVVVLDDAHTSENYIASLWTLRVQRENPDDATLFQTIVGIVRECLDGTSYARLVTDEGAYATTGWVEKVPTPYLADVANELDRAIQANMHNSDQRYAWRMIRDHLHACQMYLSHSEFLIRPLLPPTWTHSPFEDAKQRIYLSATLGAGGDLERLTGRARIHRLAIPDGWDRQGIGRRFFAFPEKSLTPSESVDLRRRLMRRAGRSVVLTPGEAIAQTVVEEVKQLPGYRIYSGRDLEERKAEFVAAERAVAVIANRYDGIDLPDDDCRLLFIEGLPRTVNLQERFFVFRMGASLLFNERIQTRVLQAVGRCTRGLNDYSMVVVTGDDLPAYLTHIERRQHFHPELQAELDFGINQSTGVQIATFDDNFRIFLAHDAEWEDVNATILESRDGASRQPFPAMQELDSAVSHEIAWQKAMWLGDYGSAFESARDVLGHFGDEALRGYRMLWHYLAGSAASLAARAGTEGLSAQAADQFERAKSCSQGISWLVNLIRNDVVVDTTAGHDRATVMLQVEGLEGYLTKLGTIHNHKFSEREKEIREGLGDPVRFEQAQLQLGRHLGFDGGKCETDGSPDPWWCIGDIAIVFEDHADASPNAAVNVHKARQAASHPAWLAANAPIGASQTIHAVLLTPATKARKGAMPHLAGVAHWDLADFRSWANEALVTIRELRRDFRDPGDSVWRARAVEKLQAVRADGPGLLAWLMERPANQMLECVR